MTLYEKFEFIIGFRGINMINFTRQFFKWQITGRVMLYSLTMFYLFGKEVENDFKEVITTWAFILT